MSFFILLPVNQQLIFPSRNQECHDRRGQAPLLIVQSVAVLVCIYFVEVRVPRWTRVTKLVADTY